MANLLLILFLNGAFERYSVSARATALAHAMTTHANGLDAVRFNPAMLSYLKENHLSAGYEYFMSGLEGLHNIHVGFARPFLIGGIGVNLSEFGFTEQKEQAITCAYGIHLSKDFSFGIGSDVYLINNARTGTAFSYGLNVGFLATVYKKWWLGVYGHNLNKPRFEDSDYGVLPYELRAGLGYSPFSDILSIAELSLVDDDMRVHVASEFNVLRIVQLRAGVKTNPTVISAGLGIKIKFIRTDYAVEYVPELPLTHCFTINIIF